MGFFLYPVLLCLFAGCVDTSRSPVLDYVPQKVLTDQAWGMVGADGGLWADGKYDGMVSPVINGLFSMSDPDGKVSVWRATRRPAIVGGLDDLRCAGIYAEGLIPVVDSCGRVAVADGFGRVKFVISDFAGEKVAGCGARFSDGVLPVRTESGLWGGVDREGNRVIDAVYGSEFIFFNGHAVVMDGNPTLTGDSRQISIIDKSGRETFRFSPSLWPEGQMSPSGWIAYGSPGGYGLVNAAGRRRALPAFVRGIHDFDDTSIIYIDEGGYRGLVSTDGNIMLAPRYNSLDFGARGLLLASNSQRYLLIDRSGRIVSDFDHADEVVSFGILSRNGVKSSFGYAARFGTLWTIYDISGTRVGNYEFSWLDIAFLTDGFPSLSVDGILSAYDSPESSMELEFFIPDSVQVIPDYVIRGVLESEVADSLI